MYDCAILGASGVQGKIVARDLLERGHRVLLTDLYREGSERNLERFAKAAFEPLDVRERERVARRLRDSGAPLVVNCAESEWNLGVHLACLEAGVHVVDLDSDIPTTRRQLELDPDFRAKGLTAITGCGSAPGINSVMLNFAQKQLETLHTVHSGFAWESNLPAFVVPFSIPSIVWEFTQPATILEDGRFATRGPLSEPRELDLRGLGRRTGHLVEHTEVATFHHYFQHKGLKNIRFYAGFPEHSREVLEGLIRLGLASEVGVRVDRGVEVLPLDVLTQVLKRIDPPEGYLERETLWVELLGEADGQARRIFMECTVDPLEGWEDAGCNIDTGLPAAAIARMILDGRIRQRGSFAPEAVVPERELFGELAERGMSFFQDGVVLENAPDRVARDLCGAQISRSMSSNVR